MLQVRLLGRFEVRLDSHPVEIPSRPAQSLFAYLLLNPGQPQRREKLAGLLWPEAAETNARSNLRHTLWRIRKVLEPVGDIYLQADDLAVTFRPQLGDWLDVALLEAPWDGQASPDSMADVLLYGGELLPGFYDEWVSLWRERLQALFERRMGQWIDYLVAAERWMEVLEWGERWIGFGQTPEAAYRALMLAHASLGDGAAAAAVYRRGVEALQEALGVKPSEQTRNMFEQILEGKIGSGASSAITPELPYVQPLLSTSGGAAQAGSNPYPRSPNLPHQLTSFIGRQREIREIKALLAEVRLVTLTGPGGTGKTRLALQVCTDLRDDFPDGIFFIQLASLSDHELVLITIAQTLNVRDQGGGRLADLLTGYLQDRNLLLLLDNFEQVLPAAEAIGKLLAAAPGLRVLVTSRALLQVYGEVNYSVSPLAIPSLRQQASVEELMQVESVALFVARAKAAKSDFTLNWESAQQVVEICRRLDGLPLAIELAAARMRVLSLKMILTHLDSRLRFLTGGARDLPARQQTLRATIDWSYNLLKEDEQRLFRRLAVFVGGGSLQAVQMVCSPDLLPDETLSENSQPGREMDLIDALATLVDQSLLRQADDPSGETRYIMLETIREYALEKLAFSGEEQELRQRLLVWAQALAEEYDAYIDGEQSKIAVEHLEQEHPNLRAALEASLAQPGWTLLGYRLANQLAYFWKFRSYIHEGLEWFDRLLAQRAGIPEPVQVETLSQAGFLANHSGDFARARNYLELALELQIKLGGREEIARLNSLLSWAVFDEGDPARALQLVKESLTVHRETGDEWWTAVDLKVLSHLAYFRDDFHEALERVQESLAICYKLNNHAAIARRLTWLGHIYQALGNYTQARQHLIEGLRLSWELGENWEIAVTLAGIARLACGQGHLERAAWLVGVTQAVLGTSGAQFFGGDRMEYERTLSELRALLGEDAFESARRRGATQGRHYLDDTIQRILDEPEPGEAGRED